MFWFAFDKSNNIQGLSGLLCMILLRTSNKTLEFPSSVLQFAIGILSGALPNDLRRNPRLARGPWTHTLVRGGAKALTQLSGSNL